MLPFFAGLLLGSGLTALVAVRTWERLAVGLAERVEKRVMDDLSKVEMMTFERHQEIVWRNSQALKSRAMDLKRMLED